MPSSNVIFSYIQSHYLFFLLLQMTEEGEADAVATVPLIAATTMKAPQRQKSQYLKLKHPFLVHVLGPLFFVLLSPSVVLSLWYANWKLDGSVHDLIDAFKKEGCLNMLITVWGDRWRGSQIAWTIIAVFASLELLLMKIVPGRTVLGATTPAGHTPEYKDNGLACFLFTLLVYILSVYYVNLFSPMLIYDHFGEILGALSMLSFAFCAFLYVKGIWFPTAARPDHSGNPLFDFYWGTELHPRILGWDVKQFTNCRFGMMSWGMLNLVFAHAQWTIHGAISNSMLVSVSLQFVYIAKFYLWEAGYLRSLDIMHDRAGFYICWGCMVWVPGFYTLTTQYLVNHPNIELSSLHSITILLVGTFFILLNYEVDRQRKLARETKGKCIIWGKPAQFITASYTDQQGNTHQSILLTSGWWGCSRHFHYIPEVLSALCWCVPAMFTALMPYLYVIFLTLLLLERAFRDDARCRQKYSMYWDQYCDRVKYLIVPGVL